jgi:hypothetical protein
MQCHLPIKKETRRKSGKSAHGPENQPAHDATQAVAAVGAGDGDGDGGQGRRQSSRSGKPLLSNLTSPRFHPPSLRGGGGESLSDDCPIPEQTSPRRRAGDLAPRHAGSGCPLPAALCLTLAES